VSEPVRPDGGSAAIEASASIVEFYSLYPDVRGPELASPDLRGAMPARAARVCAPMTVASGFGWYVYPPVDFAVRWDGRCAEWSLLEENEPTGWLSLSGGVTGRLPAAPDALRAAPDRFQADFDVFDKYGGVPFIEADPHDGQTLEVITGVLARTPPGWWLLVRDVPNRPHGRDHQILEGMVETDWYRAYLPTMVRLNRQNATVRFHRRAPIMAVQPIPRAAVEMARRPPLAHRGLGEFPDDVWEEFVAWRRYKQQPSTVATYVREQRERARRRRAEEAR
jgi:Family of unknown function (DUF6065)